MMKTATEYANAMREDEVQPIRRILFLDLDGTVRKGFDELGRFVNTAKDVEVFPEALREMQKAKLEGWHIVAIANQGGCALGHLSYEDMFTALHETQRQCNQLFDLIFACRHHPDAKDPLMAQCWCRKPKIGNVVEAARLITAQYGGIAPPSECLFVGDREEDRQCAENAGIPFMWAKDWRTQSSPLCREGPSLEEDLR